MDIKLDEEAFKVYLTGDTNEIKEYLLGIKEIVLKGNVDDSFNYNIENIEKISSIQVFNPNEFYKIFYNKNTIKIVPNSTGREADEIRYKASIIPDLERIKQYVNSKNI